jgi:hypothetical protein
MILRLVNRVLYFGVDLCFAFLRMEKREGGGGGGEEEEEGLSYLLPLHKGH